MLTKNDLWDWFIDLSQIIFDTHLAIDIIQRIRQPKNETEKQILSIGFFSLLHHQSRFVIIIQLCKLFDESKNQKRNFYRLFNRLSSDSYDKILKSTLGDNKINEQLFSSRKDIITAIQNLSSEIEPYKDLIEKVITSRDKLYAHSDPNFKVQFVTDNELETVIKLATKVFNELHNGFFDYRFAFDKSQDWRINEILAILSKFKQEDIEKHKH
jgi:AbiU2